VKIDGQATSYTPSSWTSVINTRLGVPSYVDISVDVVGNASGGTATFAVTAEQDLGTSAQIKLWSAIVENNFTAPTGWGLYSGSLMMWVPRAILAGPQGTVLSFTGPYPQTLTVTGPAYQLDPVLMNFANLKVVSFVQVSTGTRDVLNASYVDLPDTNTGFGDSGTSPDISSSILQIGPNPTSGDLNVYTLLPTGTTGTVSVFDLDGRIVDSFTAGGAVSTGIETPGVYFVRLQTSSGEVQTRSCTVLR